MDYKNRIRTAARIVGIVVTAWLAVAHRAKAEDAARAADEANPQAVGVDVQPTNPLDAHRAYGYLLELCAIGPRPSGSDGMEKQRTLLEDFFKKAGGKVTVQRFRAKNPLGGDDVPMTNIIVEWHPERKERILLCAHYDTRPHADRDIDPVKRRDGVFLGANDGASGVAVLMELAQLMPKLEGTVGVDFLLVDGEELVYTEERDPYFLGSTWFARQYVKNPPPYKYRWGVVLDMVGDTNLSVYQDRFSATWTETRPLVKGIWATAARLGVKEFIPRVGYEIRDDHFPLRNTAKIPTCDVIDFDYPQWHTTLDNPQHCAGSSLAKVGWVVYEWLKSEELAAVARTAAKPQAKSGADTSPWITMLGTYIVSLLLIGLSGLLLDFHRRSWRATQQMESISPADLRFARSQYRRRMQSSATIGVLGAVLGVYPLVPRIPLPFTLYLVAITLACMAIMMLAALDAWATRQNFLRLRSEQMATQIKLTRDLRREQTRYHDG